MVDMKLTCLLYVPRHHRLADQIRTRVRDNFEILAEVDKESLQTEEALAMLKPDWVFSFLSPIILRGALLEFPNVNFHPAPPSFPGRGAASYALYEKSPTYGATAHRMIREVDAGEIYKVRYFELKESDTCDRVFERAEDLCLDLFQDIVQAIDSKTLKPCSEKWTRKATKRKDFERWMVLDINDKDDFERKIRAAKHPSYKGPYIYVHGHRFCFDE